jgi:hypothetical protein
MNVPFSCATFFQALLIARSWPALCSAGAAYETDGTGTPLIWTGSKALGASSMNFRPAVPGRGDEFRRISWIELFGSGSAEVVSSSRCEASNCASRRAQFNAARTSSRKVPIEPCCIDFDLDLLFEKQKAAKRGGLFIFI